MRLTLVINSETAAFSLRSPQTGGHEDGQGTQRAKQRGPQPRRRQRDETRAPGEPRAATLGASTTARSSPSPRGGGSGCPRTRLMPGDGRQLPVPRRAQAAGPVAMAMAGLRRGAGAKRRRARCAAALLLGSFHLPEPALRCFQEIWPRFCKKKTQNKAPQGLRLRGEDGGWASHTVPWPPSTSTASAQPAAGDAFPVPSPSSSPQVLASGYPAAMEHKEVFMSRPWAVHRGGFV